jgi:hypothetical protein
MKSVNPIPSLDDVEVSRKFHIGFTFDECVSLEEAVISINNLLKQNGSVIPKRWVKFGDKSRKRKNGIESL